MTATPGATTGSAPRTLADWLRAWPDERLAALLQARPDLCVPVPPDIGVLTARAAVRLSVLRALESVDAFGLTLLDALVIADAPLSLTALGGLLGPGVPTSAVKAGVQRLRDLALVWGEDSLLHLVGPVRDVVGPTPAGLGRPAAVLLARCADRTLEAIGTELGLGPRAGLAEVTAALEEPGRLLSRLTADERRVLETLSAGPPLGQVRDAAAPGQPDSPVRRLIAKGLLVPVDRDAVELPREVGLALRGDAPLGVVRPTPPALVSSSPGPGTVDTSAALAAATAVSKVEALLESWGNSPPTVLRAGGLGVRELKRTARELDVTEQVAALLIEVAAAAGLLDQSPGLDPDWLPTAGYDTWRSAPTESKWLVLARAWLGLTRQPGLAGERDDRDKVVAALSAELERPTAPAERRRVLDALAEVPPGTAPTPESLEALLTWRAPRRGGALRDRVHRWTLEQADVLGVSGRGGLASFTMQLLVNDERAAARTLSALLPDPLDHVLIQPDLTIVAPGPLERELAGELALVADVESTGGATVYRVSESSVRRALDAGRSASELHDLFGTRSRTPVPQGLSYLVDDVARRHGRLRAGKASSYLRCDDEALLSEVLADKRTATLRLRRLAPTVLTSASPVDAVLESLRGAGYAPAAEAADGALLVARPRSARTAVRQRPTRVTATALGDEQARLAVQALRAGDLAARASRRAPVTTTHRSSTADTLAFLQSAARERRQVWLGYVNGQGQASTRVVEPRVVEGGFLSAWDHLRQEERTFALHRVTAVADVDGDEPA